MCTDKRKKPICINTSNNIIPSDSSSDSSPDSSSDSSSDSLSDSSSDSLSDSSSLTDNIPKKELYIYYENEKMPKNGWMQSCFKCELFTAKTLIYREEVGRIYFVYICNNCKKTLTIQENNLKFRKRCDKFIKRYLED
jgi:hypothetical protein